ncbi:major facilitator superfamily transporter [Xylariales sp. AK1849]|nr:major facilitator superfamily transporter [Xylariales sp. AK1849]
MSASSARSNTVPRTPDSDSGSDRGEDRNDLPLLEAEIRADGLDGANTYELQDLKVENPPRSYDEIDQSYRGTHGYGPGSTTRRRLSESTSASFQLYTPDEEQAVVRKFDRRLVLFLSVCYMLSFLDRSNIGNARLAGMEQDLQTRPPKDEWYEWSLTCFYIAYITFEWMSLLFKVIPAHIYISLIVLSWGITASLQSVAASYPVLIFLRILLGIGEAGFTGVPLYLSFFFKKNELAFRTALFISAAPLATTFASSLAWLILRVGGSGPIAPWRLLFLLEGFPSVIISIIAWGLIPDSPQTAGYLTAREKKVARLRLRHEKPRSRKNTGHDPQSSALKLREVISVFADPKAWITAFMFFLTNMAYSSLPVFLPTILEEMGHSALESQALSAPPYLIAFGGVLLTAHLSDRMQIRAPFIIVHALASAVGYTVMALARPLHINPMLRYLAVYPAAIGFFNVVVLIIAWSINNQSTESRQSGGFALLQVIGQCGPLVGTRLYPKRDEPFFEPGMWACASAMTGVSLLTVVLRSYLSRQNRKLDSMGSGQNREETQGLVESASDGGKEPSERFRFML